MCAATFGYGGGVGSMVVQIAKADGADVTAVTGPRTVELVRSLGADRVIDYTKEDFTRTAGPQDVTIASAATGRFAHWAER